MPTRRQFLKMGGASAAALAASAKMNWLQRLYTAWAQAQTLDHAAIPKYQMPLVKPPAMPGDFKRNKDKYKIAVKQFQQQILPSGYGMTTVWSYGPDDLAPTLANGYFYPAFTIEATWNKDTQVLWRNRLVDAMGVPLPHLLPVDPSLHWANPIGRRDTRPNPTDDPGYWNHPYIDPSSGNYAGPVPMVTHVHGAHTTEDSDGYAEAWYLPAEAALDPNINWATGTFFDYFNSKYAHGWMPGTAAFKYPNNQRATTLWYHDHTLGMTRLNVYAGPAGFWLIRGGPDDVVLDKTDNPAFLPGPAPIVGDDPFGTYYEIPIAIQDRSFLPGGSLFYPDNRAFFEGLDPGQLQIPFIFDQLGINPDNGWGLGCDGQVSDVSPIWQPEFFGEAFVVNGQTWPYLEVEPRRYRFRLLNGCNSRFLSLRFEVQDAAGDPIADWPVWQIGAEGGFLPEPVQLTILLMALAERADIIVDFTDVLNTYPAATRIVMKNDAPDSPFGGDLASPEDDPYWPQMRDVMEFRFVDLSGEDTSTPADQLVLPAITRPWAGTTPPVRKLSLNEEESKNIFISQVDGSIVYDCDSETPFGPTAALLGTMNADNTGNPLLWMANISENPALGASEEWELYNFTADAHPIHVHLVQFEVVNRQALVTDDEGMAVQPAVLDGDPRPPEAWETGWKDTVISYPGEVTRIRMKFDYPGFYVWHCHIVEHEDNEMMRPYHVGPIPPDAPAQ